METNMFMSVIYTIQVRRLSKISLQQLMFCFFSPLSHQSRFSVQELPVPVRKLSSGRKEPSKHTKCQDMATCVPRVLKPLKLIERT